MNPDNLETALELVKSYSKALSGNTSWSELIVAPPSILVGFLKDYWHEDIAVAVQDISNSTSGAFTGQISAKLASNLGISHAIIGHSESRKELVYVDKDINKKVGQCLTNSIVPILCVGYESKPDENSAYLAQLVGQIQEGLAEVSWSDKELILPIIAWEPTWAIGSGKAASLEQINQTHIFIKQALTQIAGEMAENIPILYGGSVNSSNLGELYNSDHIDGFLVGGASLKPLEAEKIIKFA